MLRVGILNGFLLGYAADGEGEETAGAKQLSPSQEMSIPRGMHGFLIFQSAQTE
jgi:hypothetical protein